MHSVPRETSIARPRVMSAGELAWLAVLPCSAVVVAAVVLLGPSLGGLLPVSSVTFWPRIQQTGIAPEPTEQARFLLSLTAPLLLAACVLGGLRRRWRLRPTTIGALVLSTQIAGLLFFAVCYAVQRAYVFTVFPVPVTGHTVYFTIRTIAVAFVIASALAAVIAREELHRRAALLIRDTPSRQVAAVLAVVVLVAIWSLPAIQLERTISAAHEAIYYHLPFWLDETFAVLDGRSPLADFAAQYGSLWPYPIAAAMSLLGKSVGVFTVAMSLIGATAMLAVFATIRRVVRSTMVGAILFLPLLATSFFMMEGPLDNRYAVGNLFGTFPLRYAGPFILLWALARHLDGVAPRGRWWLFSIAGLVVLNNGDFGIPALGATVAALLWTSQPLTAGALRRLAAQAAIGLAAAFVLVSVLTEVRAGTLPHLELLFRYARLFATAGWGMTPITPVVGMSTVIYLTYVAAIGVATVRAAQGDPDRLMTGLLAWSGVFGLGIGSYYVGRSHPEVLVNMFAAWALAVTLLAVVAIRSMVARSSRRPSAAEAACLLGLGLLVCSLGQTPTPWSQIARLRAQGEPVLQRPTGQAFIARHTRPGERVAILTPLGHRAADSLDIVDVTPYTGLVSMPAIDQLDETLAALDAEGGHKVFVGDTSRALPELMQALVQRGYRVVAREPRAPLSDQTIEFSDAR